MINNLNDLVNYLRKEEKIYIFGAGLFGKYLLHALTLNEVGVLGFLVSQKGNNPETVEGIKVYSLCEEDMALFKSACVIIGFSEHKEDAAEILVRHGFSKIIRCLLEIKKDLIRVELKLKYQLLNGRYEVEIDWEKDEKNHAVLIDKCSGSRKFRIRASSQDLERCSDLQCCDMDIYEQQYGIYHKIPFEDGTALSDEFMRDNQFEIYAATGVKDIVSYEGTGLIPIQIGAALTKQRSGYITDDSGDQISQKNKNYSECTALYWVWKNTSGQDYVGLCHYRRRFELYEESIHYIKENKIDVVTTLPQYIDMTVKKFFLQFISAFDWDNFKTAIIAYNPDYEELFGIYENSHFFIACNLSIMKRGWFDQYCAFAFDVAQRIENRYEIIRQDRYMGYLFENMLSFFIMVHHDEMKVACTNMIFLR